MQINGLISMHINGLISMQINGLNFGRSSAYAVKKKTKLPAFWTEMVETGTYRHHQTKTKKGFGFNAGEDVRVFVSKERR